jgi:hypothetical protein
MNQNKLNTLKDFVAFCKQELNIQTLPKVSLINDKDFVEQNRSFGEYNPQTNAVRVVALNRNLADICRSLAHELCHHRQNELGLIYTDAGETGTDIENDANAMAGILMRDYGKRNIAVYDLPQTESLREIGEGTQPFPWHFNDTDEDGNYFYSFKTPKNDYSVGIADLEDGMYELSFNTVENASLDTNEGVMLKVLSTVVEITKDFIQKAKPDIMYFRPIKTGGPEDSRRGRIYAAYLKKNLPSDYNLMTTGDTFRVIKK